MVLGRPELPVSEFYASLLISHQISLYVVYVLLKLRLDLTQTETFRLVDFSPRICPLLHF